MSSYPKPHKYQEEDSSNEKATTLSKVDESQIWDQFRNGEETAFIYIYKTYFNQLYNFAFQFTSDEYFIKDQIQDLFVYIRLKKHNLTPVQSIKFYLFKALRRKVLKSKRKLAKQAEAICGNFSIEVIGSYEQKLIDIDVEKRKVEMLSEALNLLTLKQREAVILFYFEGFAYSQIAEIMNYRNAKQVRKIIYRAIDTLRTHLTPGKAALFYSIIL